MSSKDENFNKLLPVLLLEDYVFCNFPSSRYGDHVNLKPIASFNEIEGFFVNRSPEARRRFFKMSRQNENVMRSLKYSNKIIHPDLMLEWSHFKDLNDVIGKELRYCKPIKNFRKKTNKKDDKKLPPISKKIK